MERRSEVCIGDAPQDWKEAGPYLKTWTGHNHERLAGRSQNRGSQKGI